MSEAKELEVMSTQGKSNLVTKETIADYLKSFGLASQLDENETMQFMTIACSFQLNPFKREVYCIPYKSRDGRKTLSIVIGYEVYLKRAERSGQLSGWKVWVEDTSGVKKAVIEIHRKDWKTPLRHEVYMSEYKQDNRMWQQKPLTMLKKVAISSGFRLAFPCECGGMPYSSEEVPFSAEAEDSMKVIEVKVEPVAKAEQVLEEVQNQIELAESVFAKALRLIPTVKTDEELQKIANKVELRFQEGLLSAEEVLMISDKINERFKTFKAENTVSEVFPE